MSKLIKLCTLKVCNILYISYTLVKLFFKKHLEVNAKAYTFYFKTLILFGSNFRLTEK